MTDMKFAYGKTRRFPTESEISYNLLYNFCCKEKTLKLFLAPKYKLSQKYSFAFKDTFVRTERTCNLRKICSQYLREGKLDEIEFK